MLCSALIGCSTAPKIPAANLAEPGWTLRQGQALWKPKRNAPEIAGELVVATRPDGRTFVQFIKTPFPIAIAQTTSNLWELQIPAQNRVVGGRGVPPARVAWLQLARALGGNSVAGPWRLERKGSEWAFQNPRTGEALSGHFSE
jgi:hypothetical protein